MILPETAAQKLLVSHGRVVGVRTGDKGRNREGGELGNFEAGSDLVAKVTVLAEGTQGHLTGVALDRFDLRGEEPQVWELAVKEVWKVAKPLDRVIHTMGWPLRDEQALPRVRRLVHLPDGRGHGHDRPRRRARLPRRVALGARPAAGAEDAPQDPQDPGGRRARAVGSEDDSERRLQLAAAGAARAGPAPLRRRRRDGQRPAPQGHPLRDRVGPARRRGRVPRAAARRDARERALVLRRRGARQLHLERPARGAEHAPGLRARLLRRRRAGERDDDVEGPRRAREDGGGAGRRPAAARHRPGQELPGARRQAHLRQALVGLRVGQQDPRRPAEPHPDRAARAARGRRSSGRTCARRRCTRSEGRTTTAR